MYDEHIFYRWTYKEWLNRIKGAKLAVIDAHELNVQAAYIGALVQRAKNPKKPHEYFNANEARTHVINGTSAQPRKADFTLYDKMKESMKTFNWAAAYSKKEK